MTEMSDVARLDEYLVLAMSLLFAYIVWVKVQSENLVKIAS